MNNGRSGGANAPRIGRPRAAKGTFPYPHENMAQVLAREAAARAARTALNMKLIKLQIERPDDGPPAAPQIAVGGMTTAARARTPETVSRCEGKAPEGTSGAPSAGESPPANALQARPPSHRGKIDLATAPSAMEQLADSWRNAKS